MYPWHILWCISDGDNICCHDAEPMREWWAKSFLRHVQCDDFHRGWRWRCCVASIHNHSYQLELETGSWLWLHQAHRLQSLQPVVWVQAQRRWQSGRPLHNLQRTSRCVRVRPNQNTPLPAHYPCRSTLSLSWVVFSLWRTGSLNCCDDYRKNAANLFASLSSELPLGFEIRKLIRRDNGKKGRLLFVFTRKYSTK